MRIHLGHHFYGAGNIGDDFMMAGFLAAAAEFAPDATFTSSVPFDRSSLGRRFPDVEWLDYTDAIRRDCIERCDVWLGIGGSPFQSAQSTWFIDHLLRDAAWCAQHRKPMYFLGVGVQSDEELERTDVIRLLEESSGIWTRDQASSRRLSLRSDAIRVRLGADLAHLYFQSNAPAAAKRGRLTAVINTDFAGWPGQQDFLRAARTLEVSDRVWLAQETRSLAGAEKLLFEEIPEQERSEWRLVDPQAQFQTLNRITADWPSGEWTVTSRHHTAIAAAWAGSKLLILPINAKLRSTAEEMNAGLLSATASKADVETALSQACIPTVPREQAKLAYTACRSFFAEASGKR